MPYDASALPKRLSAAVDVERTELRRASVEGGASGVLLGAGRVKVKVCTVDAGCRVDAIISTSRVNES